MQKLLFAFCCAGSVWAWWSTPVNLGIDGVHDFNPQVCREQVLNGMRIVLVWESFLDGNMDILSRFSEGLTWSDTFRITSDLGHDVFPRVAYDGVRDCFWCVWSHNSAGDGDIFISQGNETTGWSVPFQLTSGPLDDQLPAVCVSSDTVWVVWQRGDMVGGAPSCMNIHACYYDGTTWSAPCALTNDADLVNRSAEICMWYGQPLVVWERSGDIYYCEYQNGSWQMPQSITSDVYEDVNPEVAALWSVWVVWQTDRDGNQEIYTTACDNFSIHERMTFHDSVDNTPSPLQFIAIGRQVGPPITAFSSTRSGNGDIYTHFSLGYPGDTLIRVDTSSAADVKPVMTGNILYLWVIWQTERSGDWGIYGSYIFLDQVKELDVGRPLSAVHISPNPAKRSCTIHSPVPVRRVRIFDALGKLVRAVEVKDRSEIELSLAGMSAGIYFIRASNADSETTCKIVISR